MRIFVHKEHTRIIATRIKKIMNEKNLLKRPDRVVSFQENVTFLKASLLLATLKSIMDSSVEIRE